VALTLLVLGLLTAILGFALPFTTGCFAILLTGFPLITLINLFLTISIASCDIVLLPGIFNISILFLSFAKIAPSEIDKLLFLVYF